MPLVKSKFQTKGSKTSNEQIKKEWQDGLQYHSFVSPLHNFVVCVHVCVHCMHAHVMQKFIYL